MIDIPPEFFDEIEEAIECCCNDCFDMITTQQTLDNSPL